MPLRNAPTVWTLTALTRIRSRDRPGPVALKSTPASRAIPQLSRRAPRCEATSQVEAYVCNTNSVQASTVLPNQAQAGFRPLDSAAAVAPPSGQLVQAPVPLQHTIGAFGSALPACAGSEAGALVPMQLQQTLQRGEPALSTSTRMKQLHQVQADSSGSRQGRGPEQDHHSSAIAEQHVMPGACASTSEPAPDQLPAHGHSGQQAPRQPQTPTVQGTAGLGSISPSRQQHHSAAPRAPVSLQQGEANGVPLQSSAARHSPSQASTMAYTGATQSYNFRCASTEMPSQTAGTQPLSDRTLTAGHAALHDRGGQPQKQNSMQQPPAGELHAAGHSPQAPLHEVAGPSARQVSKLSPWPCFLSTGPVLCPTLRPTLPDEYTAIVCIKSELMSLC